MPNYRKNRIFNRLHSWLNQDILSPQYIESLRERDAPVDINEIRNAFIYGSPELFAFLR